MNEFYNNCRWCRFLVGGVCQRVEIEQDTNLDEIIEDGVLSDTIREAFKEMDFVSVGKNKKSQFAKELEEAIMLWVEGIDEAVSIMLHNRLEIKARFSPEDRNDFWCVYFE